MTSELSDRTRVVLADDHRIVRHAIRIILEGSPKYQIVAECSNADETIAEVSEKTPEFLILDLGLPGKSGLEVIHEIVQQKIPTKAVVLTMYDDEPRVRQAFSAGARAYLLKNSSPEEFLSALDKVSLGELYVGDAFSHLREELEPLVNKASSDETLSLDPLSRLSKREREVFYLLADGIPNRVIAKKLFISPRTVETHRARVIRKLGFSSTADLIRYAIRNNLMTQ